MSAKSPPDIQSLDELRRYVHHTLCLQENLLEEQFPLVEQDLYRNERPCGLKFILFGPRQVRLEAIWDSMFNTLYTYNTRGERFGKVQLNHRLS